MLTPSLLESRLIDSLAQVSLEDLPSSAQARRTFKNVRARFGLSYSSSVRLLSGPAQISKMAKTRGEVIVSLALSHADTSGIANTCAFFGECREGCVATSGNGSYENVTRARKARLRLLVSHPAAFLRLLVDDLDHFTARAEGAVVASRLNAYSDIRWERVLPSWFWARYEGVRFYDYTKHPLVSRPQESLPPNYFLTYSRSELTREGEIQRALEVGRNVAVVISTRGGKIRGTGEYRPIPDTLFGAPVVDGDLTDSRHSDPAGSVVALRRKGTLRADSPFVVAV